MMAFDGVQDLIIDTDMSIDVDDVGMLCAAHALVDLGEARILAVLHRISDLTPDHEINNYSAAADGPASAGKSCGPRVFGQGYMNPRGR